MFKKIMSIMLAFMIVFSLAGCSSSKEEETAPEPQTQTEDDTLTVINGLEFHLDKERSFKDLYYTTAEDFREIEHDEFTPYIQYDYLQEDDTNLLFFRIFYYQNKGFDAAVADLGIESDIEFKAGSTDNIEYQLYEQPRDDGGTIHFYFIDKDGSTYVLSFISRYDIARFETKTVSSVHF
ncbi:MAG: hypothetical protein IKE38_00860 [Erysipelotrichaceae bacterium]|nr:hypothetical protein [Erysipelotrichaceae bacterium]